MPIGRRPAKGSAVRGALTSPRWRPLLKVGLVLDLVKDQDASVTAACRKVGGELGIKADTLRGWAKQAQIDRGLRPGTASADAARIRALERENAELRRVNAILRTASAFFAAELGHR